MNGPSARNGTLAALLVAATLAGGIWILGAPSPPAPSASRSVPAVASRKPLAEYKASPARQDSARSQVVVVGAGISGLAAALELGRGGAEVVVLDMSSVYGGHAVMSQGSLSIVDSPLQAAAKSLDSPDLAYNDFLSFGDDSDPEWVRFYVDHSRELIYDWVKELGVRFEGVVASPGNSVPREHQPMGRGIGLVTPIYRECLNQPTVRFVWNTKVEQLLQKDGRVTGVIGRNLRTGAEQSYEAGAVVLATGGFQSNLEMVREFWPAEFRFPDRSLAGSGRNSIGLGHRLAQTVGGDLVKMDHQWNYFTGIPDPRYPGTNRGLSAANMYGIVVNEEGKRFANLHGWAKSVMPPLLRQKNATLWFVFDEAIKPQFVVSGTDWADFRKVEREILNNPKLVHKADTLEELERKAGLPPDSLAATVTRYNGMVEKNDDQDFQRFGPGITEWIPGASPKLETPPYYAMQAWPLTRKSMGGVAIDRKCRVLDSDRQPIEGLYAVGELSGLAGINGKAALEGTFLGPCIVTGRIAGRTILAQYDQGEPPAAGDTTRVTSTRCLECHSIAEQVASPRSGYWHFENVHRVALERGTDCRHCHAELAPYREDQHRINPLALSATCVQCHVARE
ncbi:MAG: FAD-dependent oxidoreductase [Planctomycetaceae bacterium]|nr:FAD-dependent oxidoreductase [Planctomycetaceae bacterium]